ncbi:Fe-Mn family superoxide dismutase [Citrobacter freundii]|uniref:superoxide dismutase n=1 Tax=Gammaproteobacteria TaxID=1236 RepID=UPI001922BC67|nr:Fe-Mn family superoxide dismutase [Citrobacter freundii]UDV20598.1 Fe-Mn family superoxide dismutase [Citrobacter freundii]
MNDFNQNKRDFLATSATAAAGLLIASASNVSAAESSSQAAPKGANWMITEIKPKLLSFNAAKLKGLSANLIESHWTNNYSGSVKTLNAVNDQLSQALANPDTPAFLYNDLKREHLIRTGSVILHELYFDNLGGNGKADGELRSAFAKQFGTFDRWETEFRKIAQGLGGGSGWVVLGYNTHFNKLENYWMGDHAHFPVGTVPLLVMDMYEHSYHMDFGAAAGKYIDAFFNNINWDEVAHRLQATHTKTTS